MRIFFIAQFPINQIWSFRSATHHTTKMTLQGSDVYRKDWVMFYTTPLGSHQ